MKHLTLFLISCLLLGLNSKSQTFVDHSTLENTNPRYSTGYLIADKVSLRSGPSANSKFLKTLPIGTALVLITKSDSASVIDSIHSHWYQTEVEGLKGWVWGGFVAMRAQGSNGDPSVKFLVGFSHVEYEKSDNSERKRLVLMGQIRVVKNNIQLDKITFYLARASADLHYIDIEFNGSKGIAGIDDVLRVHIPCLGGCGCSGGTHYIFLDGKKLHLAKTTWGTADADYSEGEELIFPSDMDGVEGYVKMEKDFILYDEEEDEDAYMADIMRRQVSLIYHYWNGKELVKATNIPVEKEIQYYDTENHKFIEEPTKPIEIEEEE